MVWGLEFRVQARVLVVGVRAWGAVRRGGRVYGVGSGTLSRVEDFASSSGCRLQVFGCRPGCRCSDVHLEDARLLEHLT